MNQLLSYEKQIADKMQLAPVPDIQDAVWARIEAMLDAEMNVQETETTQQITNKKNKIFSKRKITIAAIILTVILAIIINKQKRRSSLQKEKSSITVPVKPEAPVKKNNVVPVQPESTIKTTPTKKMNLIDDAGNIEPDSVLIIPPVKDNNPLLKKTDLPVMINPAPPVLQKKDSVMKKPRGVKGISVSDYRFVMPKKDSTE